MDINFTEIIKRFNSALTQLNFGRKNNDTRAIEIAQFLINLYTATILQNKSRAAEEIKSHYNNVTYDINNGSASVTTYLKESIIREILQNIIDCNYSDNIDLCIIFEDNRNTVSFMYNEEGFKISNVISFLSLDHTSKDSNNTGAFGIGAKAAIISAESMLIKSSYPDLNGNMPFTTTVKIKHIDEYGKKRLLLEELKLEDNVERNSGSEIDLVLEKSLYDSIKKNFKDFNGEKEKGRFITPLDFMFAALKKPDKEILLSVLDFEDTNNYIIQYDKCSSVVNFKKNNDHIVGMKVFQSEESKFSYLVPYSRNENGDMPNFIKNHYYNFFSTYELTGALDNNNLPKFYINIPTIDKNFEKIDDKKYYITNDRKGIQENKKSRVEELILGDFKKIISKFKDDLVLSTDQSYRYILKFLYEFIEHQCDYSIYKNKWNTEVKSDFFSNIKISHNENQYELRKFKLYEYNQDYLSEAKKIKDTQFLFIEEKYDFRRTKFDVYIKFNFVVSGQVCVRYHSANIYDEYINNHFGYSKESFLKSAHYKAKANIFSRILKDLDYRIGNEIFLISAELDDIFTQDTLLKLLKALDKSGSIAVEFDENRKNIFVGGIEYNFYANFKIDKNKILYYSHKLKNKLGEVFFEFIRILYLENLFGKQLSELNTKEKILKYKSKGFIFEYNHSSNNLIDVFYKDTYTYYKVPIEKNINVESLDYEEIVSITGITNYRLLQEKSIEGFIIDRAITDIYDFDISKIIQYANQKDADRILNKILLSNTKLELGDKNLVAFVKDGIFKEIIQLENISYTKILDESDFILIIPKKNRDGKHSKININSMSKMLDTILNAGGKIKQLYTPLQNPIMKMLDQFDFKLKPILKVDHEEIKILIIYLNKANKSEKLLYSKDLNNKLYGYSTNCCLCDYKSNILNAFQLREGIEYIEKGTSYKLSLYICANHYFELEGWIVSDLKFKSKENKYNISFENWMQEIKTQNCIEPNLLKCKIKVIKKSSYRLFELDTEDEIQNTEDDIYEMILTPLMAVKWFSENENLFDKKKHENEEND